jgi:hypothetical protein
MGNWPNSGDTPFDNNGSYSIKGNLLYRPKLSGSASFTERPISCIQNRKPVLLDHFPRVLRRSRYMQKIAPRFRSALKFITAILPLLFSFITPAYARDVTLEWTANPAVNGYKIYYRAGYSGPPYNGTGAAEGDSPIDVGWVSQLTLRALSDDVDYYFAVTAYNAYGESGYSNEVTTARSVSVNTSSGGAGGGGGGCFISAIAER